ncbi:hypothetical protein HG535_0A07860 [Zygotorulaspora mrakii]|uniref:Exonuclease V, mitochondrial n=1 Tax=Zygotorulaspora mrakii TaxID=42260 RepID=A0A7H9AX71_ZYGMR|nr:uncharacterized protein HG535_0A07860 [Zygotorulaspora mrakii]QLG70843.1 hypothetical protein HG535_0A07860 [Zygotorulaspora mrakii]
MFRIIFAKESILRKVRRFSNNCTFTHNYSVLTAEEREEVNRLPFFSRSFEEQPKKQPNKTRQKYTERKISLTKAIFGEDQENAGYLSYHLPRSMPSPYYDVYCKREQNGSKNDQEREIMQRLSVTKLLTKRWCELREAYDIYSNVDIFAHPQLLQGIASHRKLEYETHPVSEETQAFKDTFELQVPDDKFHKLAGSWSETVSKMLNIFVDGEAREVLCHGYLDANSGHLKSGSSINECDILISAVVDHLVLRKKGTAGTLFPFKLSNSVITRDGQDIAESLKQLRKNESFLKENFEIIVGDVKTRSFRRVPSHENVIKATKLQVMYYRHFLEELSIDTTSTYFKLLANAERRGFDVDQPVDPAKVISMMAQNEYMVLDMKRLRDGEPIGFNPFDSKNVENKKYNLTHYSALLNDANTIERYGDFFTEWRKPVTLRYLASRLAQVYREVGRLLCSALMVEYYVRNENFHNTLFDYDVDYLMENSHDSALFWLGKRDIEPIGANIKNFTSYCKHCDYETVCSWRKKGVTKCLDLGDDLVRIAQNDPQS